MRYLFSSMITVLLIVFYTNTYAQDWKQSGDERGLIVIPAEDYSAYQAGSGDKEGETFTLEDSIPGYIGESYVRANMVSGDGSVENAESLNIRLTYDIEFTKKGGHYVWAHVFFPGPSEDSFFFGIDGKVRGQISGSPRGEWSWHKGDTPFELDTMGSISFNIFGREPNSIIDHIIITTDPDFDPSIDDYSLKNTIAFVSLPEKLDENGNHPDQVFIDDLLAQGYEVFSVYSSSLETASSEFLDSLNSADLVIIGRSANSVDFGDTHRAAWNGIKSPLMSLQPYAVRSNRLNWLPTESVTYNDFNGDTLIAKIETPADEVFKGLDLNIDSTLKWAVSPYDYIASSSGGNGTVLAREHTTSNVLFVRWEPWLPFYDGSGDMPAAYRTLIGNGNDHANATNGDPFNYYNFTSETRQIYLNEVARMVDLPQVPNMQVDVTKIFVSPDGDDNNPGTIEEPLASLQKAQQYATAGDTVYIRGGIYSPTEEDISQLVSGLFASITYLHKSGMEGNPIKYWAYPGETPVLDFSNVKPSDKRVVGIYVEGSYIHLKGLEMTGIQTVITAHTESYCIYSRGSNNIYEEISMHDNVGTGLRHFSGGGNLFLNCDAYRNWDNVSQDGTGSNNDGFGCHPSTGAAVNVFKGCRAWFNSDDGFDIIRADESVVFDSCWAFYNGFSSDFENLGDGNGFKAGGFAYDQEDKLPELIPRHTVRFCIAVRNKANGFYANHHLGGNDWFNNSAYANGVDEFNMLNRPSREDATNIDGPGYDHVLKNNLSFTQFGTGTSNIASDLNTEENNTWDLGLNVTSSDFLSVEIDQLTRDRNPDGSLPEIELLFPTSGSTIVDAGVDIGFQFKGNAPDLGALEFDQTTSIKNNIYDHVNNYSLDNYPNPFEHKTLIRYSLDRPGFTSVSIFDLNGRFVRSILVNQLQPVGEYELEWFAINETGERCEPGVYLCRLLSSNASGNQTMIKKIILVK